MFFIVILSKHLVRLELELELALSLSYRYKLDKQIQLPHGRADTIRLINTLRKSESSLKCNLN